MTKFLIKFLVLASILAMPLVSIAKGEGGKKERKYIVEITTTAGTIKVALSNLTPKHRDNFVKLCKKGYYDNVLFHRVIKGFMIQSGDPDSKAHEPGKLYGDGGPDYTIEAEFTPELYHKKGVLAAAREGDDVNPERRSSASQFYIVTGKVYDDKMLAEAARKIDKRNAAINITSSYIYTVEQMNAYKTIGGAAHLDSQYTIFGEVIEGMDIADSISSVETDKNDRPTKDIYIIKTKVSKKQL